MKRIGLTLAAALVLVVPALVVAPAAEAGPPFGFGTVSGGSHRSIAGITAVRTARHRHFDRFVIQFDGRRVPRFTVIPKSSPVFWLDPSDKVVRLRGSAGLKVVLHGATGQSTYHGPRDLRPGLPMLREARNIGDFEAVTSWGLGLRGETSKRVMVLTRPARLVIDVHH
jgi:hypothetical protein